MKTSLGNPELDTKNMKHHVATQTMWFYLIFKAMKKPLKNTIMMLERTEKFSQF